MSALVGLVITLSIVACGSDSPEQAARPVASPLASVDAKAEWLAAMSGLCGILSGETSGLTYQASISDNRISPAEHRDIAQAAKPATDAFDAAVAALPVPPEAQPAKQAFDAYLALQKKAYAQLDAAAAANDQTALTKAYGVIQGQYATTPEGMALKASGLPEKCSYRGTYPQS
jgi:hypothetical protein